MPTRTGEVLGAHTVSELADLVAASTAMSEALLTAASCTDWMRRDPRAYGAWSGRLTDNSRRLAELLALAVPMIHSTPAPDVTPIAVAQIGQPPVWDALIAWRKDYDALYGELQTNAPACAPGRIDVPQPKAPDPDLKAYQAADTAAHAIEAGGREAKEALKATVPVVFGLACAVGAVLVLRAARQ